MKKIATFPFSIPKTKPFPSIRSAPSSLMDSRIPSGGLPPPPQPSPSKRQLQIQGPRPAPLKVSKDSHKIRKPPPHPAASAAADDQSRRQPMIIYAVSPKIIHAEVANFMAIVQRHTGLSSDDFPNSGDVSPAARLAVTERASPRQRPAEDMMPVPMADEVSPSCRSLPSILSPAPATLPSAAAAAFFSPGVQDLSPFLRNSMSSSFFSSSPSALISGNLVSPTLSPDFFSHIWDF